MPAGANNYLGLSNHPVVVAAARKALDSHGYGLSSVRFICGTQDLHKQLEARISAFHGTEDTILYPSCFDANAGAKPAHENNLQCGGSSSCAGHLIVVRSGCAAGVKGKAAAAASSMSSSCRMYPAECCRVWVA